MNQKRIRRLALLDAGSKGLGVFATQEISRGDRVLSFGGPLLSGEDIRDFTHVIQVDEGLFLGASGWIDDYVNHSCEPNCGLVAKSRGLRLVALRRIVPHEEITFDYSTCILDEPAFDGCGCESRRCRGRVGTFGELGLQLQARYLRLGIVPEFMQRSEVNGRSSMGRGT